MAKLLHEHIVGGHLGLDVGKIPLLVLAVDRERIEGAAGLTAEEGHVVGLLTVDGPGDLGGHGLAALKAEEHHGGVLGVEDALALAEGAPAVDALGLEVADAVGGLGGAGDGGGTAHEVPGAVNGVDADIQDGAAACQLLVGEPAAGGASAADVAALGGVDLTEHALIVQLAALDGLGHVAGHHGQHELHARLADGLLHSQALLQVGGQGLLAEDVLAGLGGGDAHGGVGGGPGADIHVIHVHVLQKLLDGCEVVGDAELLGGVLGALGDDIGDGDHLDDVRELHVGGQMGGGGDVARADDTDSQFVCHSVFLSRRGLFGNFPFSGVWGPTIVIVPSVKGGLSHSLL